MATPLIRVMNGHIYRVPNRRKRKPELKPSEIPTLLGYTASLVDKKWLRLAARRIMADLRKAARGRECQVRILAYVMAILKRQYWHISGWLDCAVPVSNRQT